MPSNFSDNQVQIIMGVLLIGFAFYINNKRKTSQLYKSKEKFKEGKHKHNYNNFSNIHSHPNQGPHSHQHTNFPPSNYHNISSYYYRGKDKFEEDFMELNIDEMTDEDVLRWARTLEEQDIKLG